MNLNVILALEELRFVWKGLPVDTEYLREDEVSKLRSAVTKLMEALDRKK